jgi:hypothetical protein
MKRHNIALTACIVNALLITSALSDFGVTLRTTLDDSVNTAAVRFYNAGAPNGPGSVASEVGDPVWLVFDVDGDGVFRGGPNGFEPAPSYNLPGGADTTDLRSAIIDSDDHVVFTTVAPAGRINKPFGMPSSLQTGGTGLNDAGGTVKPTYALLFRSSDFSEGGSFGFDLTAANGVIPQIGNVDLRIGQDVYADAFTFTAGEVVPPSPPTITNVTAQVNGVTVEFGFSFFAEAGASYTLLSTTNLADKPIAWTPDGDPLLGANTQTNLTATNAIPPIQKYYRLETSGP